MTRQICESDWRLFRQYHKVALDRYCAKVLSEIAAQFARSTESAHQRFLELFTLVERRNDDLGKAFDDLRRSTAWRQLAYLRAHGLLTDEEFDQFSAETQSAVAVWLGQIA